MPILFLALLSSQTSFGQDTTAQIHTAWVNLKTQLQRRTDIVSNLVNVLSNSAQVDKEQLSNAKRFSIELFKLVDTLTSGDSMAINRLNEKNNKLIQALSRTLVTSENDEKLRADNQLRNLLTHLEGCENRIAVAKREYNEICKGFGRTDILFGRGENEKAPEVKF